jgi:hypothetical protein
MKQRKRARSQRLIATFRTDQGPRRLRSGDQLVVVERKGGLEAYEVPEEIEPGRGYPPAVFAAALDRFIERHKR